MEVHVQDVVACEVVEAIVADVVVTAARAEVVVATSAAAQRVELDGAHGTTAPQTLKVYGMPLSVSTSSAAGALATNQVLFYYADAAGNVERSGPYGILIDTNAQVAVSTPVSPVHGAFTGARPDFMWTGPSTAIVAGLAGPSALGGSFFTAPA